MEGLEHIELTGGTGTPESLWVRIKGQTDNAEVITGVCCRPLRQDDNADKLFFKELRDTSKSTAIVLYRGLQLAGN